MDVLPPFRRFRGPLTLGALCLVAQPVVAQEMSAGRLHTVWDFTEVPIHVLHHPDGAVRLLAGSEEVEAMLVSNSRALVEVAGSRRTDGSLRVDRVNLLAAARESDSDRGLNFATLLCMYPEEDSPPFTKEEVERVHGDDPPGMRHYFAELSRDPSTMSGSAVHGWFTMPRPRAAYPQSIVDLLPQLAEDCIAAADPAVDFSGVYGVNLQFSQEIDGTAIGGGNWTFTLDGGTRSYGLTWLPPSVHDNYAVVAHEMGHALGWPHSSGMYGSVYDSDWDVMSSGGQIHTIASHKFQRGWIPDERVWRPAANTSETVLLARSAIPGSEGALMARIPHSDTSSYIVESRIRAGYDQSLPAEAVLIHRRAGIRSFVVDSDLNGDPNDSGAAWTVGESFEDEDIGFRLSVLDRQGDDGFLVRITRDDSKVCRLQLASEGGGTALVTAGSETLLCGKMARATAYADNDWRFAGWYEDGTPIPSSADLWLDMSDDRQIEARFAPSPGCNLALAVYPDSGGRLELSEGSLDGPCGRTVFLVATPREGWSFIEWEGAFLDFARARPYSMNASTTLRAVFEFGCPVRVVAPPDSQGVVAFREGGETGPCGRQVTLEAVPEPDWRLLEWIEGGRVVSPEPVLTLVPDSLTMLQAVFAQSCDVIVTAEPDAGGVPAVAVGGLKGECGRAVTVTPSPRAGWIFLDWREGEIVVADSPRFATTAPTSRTLRATYTPALALATRVKTVFLGGEAEISPRERTALDRLGNGDGSLDLGDLLALIELLPAGQAAAISPLSESRP